ncbi:hypothetical protein DI09_27p240 [Mitosporidium daphniae]|uniref:Tyrosinase copper-binding domain-containing protein n=1 Tax=Mitosporidium daphniae TaxID=1485682 RepID=A0A098VS40_9MICR|nr:uncharacterized protein DI09_27p240 [Mitosporidium daphniae]KGG51785.1 hypothetical protein DI09_27p240 [Mitosporidium daphniae]|eukprot:XP_013238212.1 uncharacterized protein DI09_27p240 [Mitosporidium daphniae]
MKLLLPFVLAAFGFANLFFRISSSPVNFTDAPPTEFMEDPCDHSMKYNATQFSGLVAELDQLTSLTNSMNSERGHAVCPRIFLRKEFRDMSPAEWSRFKRALLKMMDGSTTPQANTGEDALPPPTSITFWTHLHLASVPHAHGTPQFLPWHRLFLHKFELALRLIDPYVTIPYWDWSLDAPNPASSPIWSLPYLGTVYSESGDCINFPVLKSPRPHCLKRRRIFSPQNDQAGAAPFYSAKTLKAVVEDMSLTYDRFRALIELAPHNIVHVAIGGSEGDMSFMSSPNDPIFWLHHTFIDKLWADHQDLSIAQKGRFSSLTDYNGENPLTQTDVSLSDRLRPFEESVHETMDYSAPPFCYKYAPPRKAVAASLASKRHLADAIHIQRLPEPIPNSWLRMHRFNISQVREAETILAMMMAREAN